ncbi:TPA: hypothetical protein ACH3X1_006238 [Trebouxia sp. C0004]
MAKPLKLCTQTTMPTFLPVFSSTVQVPLGPTRRQHRRMLCKGQIGRPDSPLRTRLAVNFTSVPYRLDMYFQNSLWRKTIWSVTAFSSGYYAANTVSLSFGALAINDVIAAATTVGFCEVVSRAYWSSPSPGLALAFLNYFKLGVIAALIADAFKLAG